MLKLLELKIDHELLRRIEKRAKKNGVGVNAEVRHTLRKEYNKK